MTDESRKELKEMIEAGGDELIDVDDLRYEWVEMTDEELDAFNKEEEERGR